MALLIWATAVACLLSARSAERREGRRPKPARQVVHEVHARLREECRTDLLAAEGWRPDHEHDQASRLALYQPATEAEWVERWRGLAQRTRGRVVWHTEATYDFDRDVLDADGVD